MESLKAREARKKVTAKKRKVKREQLTAEIGKLPIFQMAKKKPKPGR
jgi:hypothetical protein